MDYVSSKSLRVGCLLRVKMIEVDCCIKLCTGDIVSGAPQPDGYYDHDRDYRR